MDKAHKQTDDIISELEKRLIKIYSKADAGIKKKAKEYLKEFKKVQKIKLDQLKAGKITEEQYQKWFEGEFINNQRFDDLKKQTAKELLYVNKTATSYINGKLPEVYTINYNSLADNVGEVDGYSFTLVDADTVKNLSMNDSTLLPYKEIDELKDIAWNTQKINSELLQGILQGESIEEIAERFQKVVGMDYSSALRNARTSMTSAESKGRQDGYERAEDDGIKIKKVWMSTLDNRTRHTHALLDGQSAKVKEPFKSELGDIMYPGDPKAKPANVYN